MKGEKDGTRGCIEIVLNTNEEQRLCLSQQTNIKGRTC